MSAQAQTTPGAVAAPGIATGPEAGAPVLTVDGLTISVRQDGGEAVLVDNLSFALGRGETLALAGESGSGKSLTSLAIMGLLAPGLRVSGGAVRLRDTDLTALPESALRGLRGNRVAMIFQEPMTSLNPILTIGAQLTEAIRAHEPVSKSDARVRALEALKAVRLSQPEKRMTQYPHELSGGMRQRVMIAMALALEPDVLIADEPTTALDVTVQREVLDLLRDLQREHGTAIILITHDMGVVAEMADRVVILKQGQMVEVAPVRDLFAAPKKQYTRDLLAAVPRLGDGSSAQALPEPVSQTPIASLSEVKVRFDIRGGILSRVTHRVHAVENVGFNVYPGETFSLVGESGCGKSTIAKALVGLVPHLGRIELNGHVLGGLSAQDQKALRRDVQIVFQDPMAALDPRMRVGDLVAEPLLIHGIGSSESRRATARELFDRVGLSPDWIDRYPHEFSGGQRQRICIARALALRPKLIICDESVSALDVSVQARVLDLLKSLQADFGVSYLFISHDMAVVENISDRIAVMYLGQIVEMGTRAQVFGNPQHSYTKRLIEAVPVPDPSFERPLRPRLTGDIPSPIYSLGEQPERLLLKNIGDGHLVAVG
ncbi:ABC transporter ATP-binding protein [Celeribacter neptunius]|uniref:Peptide/nickel transport system ATP-binding protein n=1 Tax=Celeribacter neptunius TaxID=588602 RepID=A0A1I3P032_9RHOB|nr:ABC transporter ATP-binding protein [Celeribacter neptunius]SFJ14913.1 peptide/nickel transport system ATP-binding protein [Celeribacter neptunius]